MESIGITIALSINASILSLVLFFMYLMLTELKKMNAKNKAEAIDTAVEQIKQNNIGPLVRDIMKLLTAIAVLLGILFNATNK